MGNLPSPPRFSKIDSDSNSDSCFSKIYNTELTRGAVEDFRNALGADWEIQRHDLTVELYVRDLGTLRSIASDPEFATFHHLEEPYLSRNHVVVGLGWVEAYIEDGKVVNVLDDGTPVYSPIYADYVRDGGELRKALA